MLKHKLKFLLISILIISVSCQKENVDEQTQELPTNAQATLKFLETQGIDVNNLSIDLDTESFIYGDDMIFSFNMKENIDKSKGDNIEKNRFKDVPLYFSNSKSVYYYMESDFPQNYRTPFAWAAWHWTDAHSNIGIRRTYTKSEADIVLSTFDDKDTGAYARAGMPTGDGNVGKFLNVNTAKDHASTSSADKMVLMIHELGHNLGFYHSDSNDGIQIPGTNDATYHTDNNCGSIMRSSVYTCGWTLSTTQNWSADDLIAIEWAY